MTDWRSIHGWWSDDCEAFYRRCVDEAPPDAKFVEVGSWQGRSAASMAEAIQSREEREASRLMISTSDLPKRMSFDCVDTWQGTPPEGDAGYHQRLIAEGGLDLRQIFEKNLRRLDLWKYVSPVQADSVEAATRYAPSSLDLVFIDGDHRREMVARDCKAWLPKLRYGGILAGDDATSENVLAGVRDAGVEPEVKGRLWWWRKRLPVRVEATPNAMLSGILQADSLPVSGLERCFQTGLTRWAAQDLPKYFDTRLEHRGQIVLSACERPHWSPMRFCICPHDEPCKDADIWRSATGWQPVFPAFPHGDWPFLDPDYRPRGTANDRFVGFCGVPRPTIRKQAIDALEESSLDHHVVLRQLFMGQEVPTPQARREYLEIFERYPYQLCCRGVGNYCYRLYETLAAGRVPLLIDTDRPLPWADFLPWEDMCVIVPQDDLGSMRERLMEHEERRPPLQQGRINRWLWWHYLSPVGWWRHWARTLEKPMFLHTERGTP